jgi:hypothetical protein
MATAGYDIYKLGFECSPIILTGGVATLIPGQMLPIIAITESLNLVNGLLGGLDILDLNEVLCHYAPNPGTELVKQEVATYPFANQTVAANSVITQPKRISYTMTCPVKDKGGYFFKLAALTALQVVLETHNAAGGLYTLVTPAKIYSNCLMLSMTHADGSATKQNQYQWLLEFTQPLITESQAATAQSNLMAKLTGQTQVTTPAWSGPATASATAGGLQQPAAQVSSLPSLQQLLGALTGP